VPEKREETKTMHVLIEGRSMRRFSLRFLCDKIGEGRGGIPTPPFFFLNFTPFPLLRCGEKREKEGGGLR